MPLYHFSDHTLHPIAPVKLGNEGIREREDLQRLLRDQIEAVAPETMVIAEEFSQWEDSSRRIDLLCLDRQANLVVIELKRDDKGGHMDLQALRYAAMVAPITFEQLVESHADYLEKRGDSASIAEDRILAFLSWDEPREQDFGSDVRIVLVAADFSPELTSSVLWLNERQLDIRCVKLSPHKVNGELLFNIHQSIPLPEGEDYQVRLKAKSQTRRLAADNNGISTGFWFVNVSEHNSDFRCWDDCRRYGYLSAGGGERWSNQIRRLPEGALVFAYVVGQGYVGLGRVTAEAVPQKNFMINDQPLIELSLIKPPNTNVIDDISRCDWCARVEWIKHLDREQAVGQSDFRRAAVCEIRQQTSVNRLLSAFGVNETDLEINK